MKKEIKDKDNLVIQSIAVGILLLELKSNFFLESDYFLKNYNFEFKQILRDMTLDSQGVVILLMYIFFVIPKEVYADNLQYNIINDFIENKINNKIYILNEDDYNDRNYARRIRNAVSHSNFIFEPEKSLTLIDTNEYHNKKPKVTKRFTLTIPLEEINILINQVYIIVANYYNNKS